MSPAQEAALRCSDCGRPYGAEFGFPDLIIPYDDWSQISPTGDDGGLLCPSCICERLHACGLRCDGAFMSGPITSIDRATMSALMARGKRRASHSWSRERLVGGSGNDHRRPQRGRDPMTKPHPARPKFTIGQMVSYLDHTGRPQSGEVLVIEAGWQHWNPEHAFIQLTVTHPTYRNGIIHINERDAHDAEGET